MMKIIAILALLIIPIFAVLPAMAQVDISDDICSGRLGNNKVPVICRDICEGSDENLPDYCKDLGFTEGTNPIYGKDGVLTRAVDVLSMLVAIIAVIVVVVSGIKMTLSQGDSQKVSNARNQIIYAAVGLAIAAVSQSIVQLILNRL